jgi:midasin
MEVNLLPLHDFSDTDGLSVITAFLQSSPIISSPLAFVDNETLLDTDISRLHTILLAYIRLLTSDPSIATRNEWPIAPLQTLRTQHQDRSVRLLAIYALSKQRQWSEAKRIEMQKQWVGDMSELDVEVRYGMEIVHSQAGGFELRTKMVDGWVLPMLEHQRAKACEFLE